MCIISATGIIAEIAVIWAKALIFDPFIATYFIIYKQMVLAVALSGIQLATKRFKIINPNSHQFDSY